MSSRQIPPSALWTLVERLLHTALCKDDATYSAAASTIRVWSNATALQSDAKQALQRCVCPSTGAISDEGRGFLLAGSTTHRIWLQKQKPNLVLEIMQFVQYMITFDHV